jgi:cardiolipin synthase
VTTDLRDFHPSLLGKANSFSQVLAIGVVLLSLIDPQPWVTSARIAMLDATIALTVLSGFHYAWVASQRIGLVTPSETAPVSMRNSHQG